MSIAIVEISKIQNNAYRHQKRFPIIALLIFVCYHMYINVQHMDIINNVTFISPHSQNGGTYYISMITDNNIIVIPIFHGCLKITLSISEVESAIVEATEHCPNKHTPKYFFYIILGLR